MTIFVYLSFVRCYRLKARQHTTLKNKITAGNGIIQKISTSSFCKLNNIYFERKYTHINKRVHKYSAECCCALHRITKIRENLFTRDEKRFDILLMIFVRLKSSSKMLRYGIQQRTKIGFKSSNFHMLTCLGTNTCTPTMTYTRIIFTTFHERANRKVHCKIVYVRNGV